MNIIERISSNFSSLTQWPIQKSLLFNEKSGLFVEFLKIWEISGKVSDIWNLPPIANCIIFGLPLMETIY